LDLDSGGKDLDLDLDLNFEDLTTSLLTTGINYNSDRILWCNVH